MSHLASAALTTMKHRRLILIVVAVLTLSESLYTQSRFRLQVAAGPSFNTSTAGVLSNWADGWTVGGGLSRRVASSTELALNISYSHYPFRGKNLQLAFPAVAGLRWNVSGKPTSTIEASIVARVSLSATFVRPFLSLTTGLYRFDIGEISVATWFDPNPQNASRSTYSGSAVSTTQGFAALGAGFSIPLDSAIRVILEGRFAQTFDSKENFVPLLATFQFSL